MGKIKESTLDGLSGKQKRCNILCGSVASFSVTYFIGRLKKYFRGFEKLSIIFFRRPSQPYFCKYLVLVILIYA